MAPSLFSLLSFFALLLVTPFVSAACYGPDGVIDTNPEYVPCTNDASSPLHTICCATNRPEERGPDICAPNGLCQVGHKQGEAIKPPQWTKPRCTNKDWNTPGCLDVCGDESLSFVTPCDAAAGNASAKWCCGLDNTECCAEGAPDSYILPVNFAEMGPPKNASSSSVSSAAASSTPIASATTSTSPTVTVTSTPTAATSSKSAPPDVSGVPLSVAAKAGIGISAAVGVVILFCIAIFIFKRNRREQHRAELPYDSYGSYPKGAISYPISNSYPTSKGAVTYAHESVIRFELPATEKSAELEVARDPKEMA